ncbi:hypothetical protein [Sorangium sp. So ce341]|uniref:hypothetical protein n=1 Tax=Sorangium sp. So ce341 TaxID=3133302 RepID=UPI003F5FF5FF
MQAVADGSYRASIRVSAAVRALREAPARLDPADGVPASDPQIVGALRAAERAHIAVYTALALGE